MGILKLFAPICAFITEEIYQNLRYEFNLKEESIHLFDWPKYTQSEINISLENQMGSISSIIQAGLGAREKMQRGVRWPLKEVIIITEDKESFKAVELLGDIVKNQLNVKEIKVMPNMPLVKKKVKANYKALAPAFIDDTPKVVSKLITESPEAMLEHLEKDGKYIMKISGKEFEILPEYLIIERDVPNNLTEGLFRKGFVYLSKEVNEELESEGYSREVMRRVQSLRKDAGLKKTDRIALFVKVSEELEKMLEKYETTIKERVGAEKIKISSLVPGKKHTYTSKENVKGETFELFLDKI